MHSLRVPGMGEQSGLFILLLPFHVDTWTFKRLSPSHFFSSRDVLTCFLLLVSPEWASPVGTRCRSLLHPLFLPRFPSYPQVPGEAGQACPPRRRQGQL